MNRFILAIASAMIATTAMAVPAIPFKKTFTQSDGTSITVGMVGDEWHSTVVTSDNYTITPDGKGDYYYTSGGRMTGVRAHDADKRSAAEQAFLAAHEKALRFTPQASSASLPRFAPQRNVGSTQVPTHGTPRIPILLVQFTDKSMSNSIATFNAQYKSGANSAYQYFHDQSWGQYQPQFDVYGIYTLPSNRATYGAHGTNSYGSDVNDIGVAQMVIDAIGQAGNAVDWSQYDNDGDGEVDVCIVVYAGVGEAQSYGYTPESIWPCQWNLYSGQYYGDGTGPVTRNGKRINRFAVFNELNGWNDDNTQIDGVGTFCHEFSHCLGLPDFYATNDSGYYGMGTWSIMCSGCYNNDGYTPCGYTAYEREFMGWMQLTQAKENTKYTLSHIADEGAQAVKITSPYSSNEYYILENRQKTGWNAYIQASGLMVNHVTYNATDWSNNAVNNSATQRMTIIAADNRLSMYSEYGDLYPYNGNNSLTDNSTPAATLYTGSLMGQPVTEITKSGNKVSFWFRKGAYTKEIPTLELDEASVTCTSFRVHWNAVDNAESYRIVATNTDDGSTLQVNNITDTLCTVSSGLEQGCTYSVRLYVKFTDGSEEFDAYNDVIVTLGEEPELYPTDEALVTTSSFKAQWRPMKRVQSYILQVMEEGYSFFNKILEETFANFTTASGTNIASTLDNYMDNPGWKGANVYASEGGIKLGGTYASGYLISPELDAAQGDNEVSMKITLATTGKKTDDYPLDVTIGDSTQTITMPAGSEGEYQLAFDCDTSLPVQIKFNMTKGYPVIIKALSIYAGNCTAAGAKAPVMSGDQHRRVYSDITDSFLNVDNLMAGTTYSYRLRALRLDGTYSMWTPIQQATTKGEKALPGDVNLSGNVDIDDVNIIIAIILGKDQADNYDRRAYVNDDDQVDIDDVNALIRIILGKD